MIRQPIVVVVGHVDHGKTKLLDKIRGTAVQNVEHGGITQAIGASIIPIDTIKAIYKNVLSKEISFTIPGLLFIDTPGHAAFTNLRKRGGSIADIAILVVDIMDGFKPQTLESIEILKAAKTPFIVAANKIDLVSGYRRNHKSLIQNITSQEPHVNQDIETKTYEIVGKLSELGFNAERFDRVEDFTKQIGIVPCSAVTGDGIAELLMVLCGLAQKFLENNLKLNVSGNAKGTILEKKETKGLGMTIDVILYDGVLSKGDNLVIGGIEKPIVTRVKALFEPDPLSEMRDKKSKFRAVDSARAATGVKICTIDCEDAIPGMPVISFTKDDKDDVIGRVQKEIKDVLIKTDAEGLVIKADTLGSLEAMTFLLGDKKIPVRRASIGKITKKDIADAETNFKDPLVSAILGFNVETDSDVMESSKVKVFKNVVIYRLIEEYEAWVEEKRKAIESSRLDQLVRPCKLQLIPNYVFRQSNPAIVGVEIMEGKLHVGNSLMKAGRSLTVVRGIQHEKENIQDAQKGMKVALSLDNVTIGRQIDEGDILYTAIPEDHFRKMKEFMRLLSKEEIALLKEIAEIMRAVNPVWGI